MNECPIYESFTLPSKGLIYDKPIKAVVQLRSMTTLDELKRCNQSDTPYKLMADVIEDCMQEKPEIHVYDMCIGDYEFLMHKLRVVTYGSEYNMAITCPNCGNIVESVADLDSLGVNEYDEDSFKECQLITLPVSNDNIELKFQTPRDLDMINFKKKEYQKKTKTNLDYGLLFTIISLIKKVNGQVLNPISLEEYAKKLSMKDVNYILGKADEMNRKVGIDNKITAKCKECGYEVVTTFRLNNEFFRPSYN